MWRTMATTCALALYRSLKERLSGWRRQSIAVPPAAPASEISFDVSDAPAAPAPSPAPAPSSTQCFRDLDSGASYNEAELDANVLSNLSITNLKHVIGGEEPLTDRPHHHRHRQSRAQTAGDRTRISFGS